VAFWDRAPEELKGEAMGPLVSEDAVVLLLQRPGPDPAGVSWGDREPRHEAVEEGLVESLERGELLGSCPKGGGVQRAKRFWTYISS
jgi:hypothetical protein